MMTLYLLRNACTTSEVSIKKIQSNLTYDVASTNIATVGGKQKWVKQYRLYNTYNLKSVISTQYFRTIVGKKNQLKPKLVSEKKNIFLKKLNHPICLKLKG
jgi:hypothetical protein